jgi:hypothetical protein
MEGIGTMKWTGQLSRKSHKIALFGACLVLSSAVFYLDARMLPGDITLLLPYILEVYLSTLLIGDRTGLNNRRGFFTLAQYETTRMRRGQDPVSLLYLDIGNFKIVNGTRGQREGDEFCVFLPEPATLSVGAYCTKERYELEDLIKEGDALMYAAKGGGKDRIACGGGASAR